MKITSIKQQAKNPERVSLFVDGKYSFSLSLDELMKEKLKKDQQLSKPELKRLKQISADGKLRARSLEWLLNRPHSVGEFKDYLYRKKADPELSNSLINEFRQKNYLNDKKFAQWLVENRLRKVRSNRAIRAELAKKGINKEVIDEVLTETTETEESRLQALINKKKNLPRYRNEPAKLIQYLIRQGFSYQLIKGLINPREPGD